MKSIKMRIRAATMVLAISCFTVSGFSPVNKSIKAQALVGASTSTTSLYGGGFGGGGMSKKDGNGKKKKKNVNKETKLKPKQQWDRYSDLKREPKIQVGVRIKDDESDEWLEVGRVKSKDSQFTEAAVFRQRAIIAEVSLHSFLLEVFDFVVQKAILIRNRGISASNRCLCVDYTVMQLNDSQMFVTTNDSFLNMSLVRGNTR